MANTPPPLAYITGASSGIGQSMALRYYQAGYRLALVARRSDEIQRWVLGHGMDPARVHVYEADVRDIRAIRGAGNDCLHSHGVPTVVVANAGISIGMDTAEPADLEVMRATLETNVLGMAASFQPFVRPMCELGAARATNRDPGLGPTLVGIASVAGIRGLPGHGAYCASKAAVISYCESLRGECRPSGVKVVTLAPGYIDTPLTRQNRYAMPFLMSPEAFAEEAFNAITRGVGFRVIPWQMDVAAKVLRLLPNAVFDRVMQGRPRKHRQSVNDDAM